MPAGTIAERGTLEDNVFIELCKSVADYWRKVEQNGHCPNVSDGANIGLAG